MDNLKYREFEIKKQFLVIDAFNFLLIAAGASLKSEEENAFERITWGMTSKLKKLFPGYTLFACWDTPEGTNFRKEISGEQYKSNRTNHPKPLPIEDIIKMKDFFESKGIINVEIPETEGDDLIFILCKKLREQYPKSEIVIVSRDKDMLQVVQKGYANKLFDYSRKKEIEVPFYDIVMYKSLVGDPADCIPGVKGIGDKGAKKLISEAMVTGSLKLNEDQRKQYEKCLLLVDATKHPRFQQNVDYLNDLLKDLHY